MARRRTGADGMAHKVEFFLLTHFPRTWWVVQRTPVVGRGIHRFVLNKAVNRSSTRPYAFSTMHDYTSWSSLTDKHHNARQLPPVERRCLPRVDEITQLFARDGDNTIPCPKSTVLFAYLAQWFTDGFLRSGQPASEGQTRQIKFNESNHEVDLGQLYGLKPEITEALRRMQGGRLKCQMIGDEMFPPKLYDAKGRRKEFEALPPVVGLAEMPGWKQDEKKPCLYAMGSDVANSHIGYAMLNILFLREHNRIADILAAHYGDEEGWDDERLFQTARNILTVKLIKLVIEEYINHIAPYHFKFKLDPQRFYGARWYRPNWLAVEFNLLYRWHSLIPSKLCIHGRELGIQESSFANHLIEERGLGTMFDDASKQWAGKICLFNTDGWFDAPRGPATSPLAPTRTRSVQQARDMRLDTYNKYRKDCSLPPVTRFEQISSNAQVRFELKRLYKKTDNIEFYVGLFAEDTRSNSVLPPLMGAMVGLHAFSQLLTNPLLSTNVYKRKADRERTFSAVGAQMIKKEASLQALLNATLPDGTGPYEARLTHADWRRDTLPRRAAAALRRRFPRRSDSSGRSQVGVSAEGSARS